MKTHLQIATFIAALSLLWGSSTAIAAENSHRIYVTPKAGYSMFTGYIGLELQLNHLALDVGYFPSGGIRYYFHPEEHSWFTGVFGSGRGYDHYETKDGIAYNHYSYIQGGIGGGYRWFWHRRWSLELGLTVGDGKRHWSNSNMERTENTIFFFPIVSGGVSF